MDEGTRYRSRSERGSGFTLKTYGLTAGVRKILARAGKVARLALAVHPHVLRHSCGYKLANDGLPGRTLQEYLGHRNFASTARYAALAERQFEGLWKD